MIGRNYINKLAVLASLSALFMLSATTTSAQVAPDFPSCSNPQGQLVVSYSQGEHAIPGESSMRQGSDDVFDLGSGNYLQCFCAENGEGVQTNWWKINGLDQNQINTQTKLGWHFIPNGANWGLDQSAYLAQNLEYSCGGGSTNIPTPTPTEQPQVRGVSGEQTSDSESDFFGSILGLADTGAGQRGIFLTLLGIVLIFSATRIYKRTRNI